MTISVNYQKRKNTSLFNKFQTNKNINLSNVNYVFRSGTCTFSISNDITCDILVIGGGGQGGSVAGNADNMSGGGGAGAYREFNS